MTFGSGYNLPPGVYESDLPGNSSADMACERYADDLGDDELVEYVWDHVVDDMIWLEEDGLPTWTIQEDSTGERVEGFEDAHAAISYYIADCEDEIRDRMVEQYAEDMADGPEW